MNRLLMFLLVIAFLSVPALAQTNDSADEPGCATAKSKSLNFLVGKWNVKSRFRLSRSEDSWETTDAVSEIKHLFQDCVYQEILTGTRDGRPHRFTGLFGFNNISDKLQWVGGHSEHGVLTLYEGDFVDDGLILENELVVRSTRIYFRIVITKTKEGFSVRSERSQDKKSWDAGWYLDYSRFPSKRSVTTHNPNSTPGLAALAQSGVNHGFPGFILAIRKGTKTSDVVSAGLANLEKQIPMKPDDRFHIASVTKLFTATAVLMLVDDGMLDLDTKVADVLAPKTVGKIPYIEEITVSQLLDHSSGIYGFNNDPDYIGVWLGSNYDPRKKWTSEELIAFADGSRVKPFGMPGAGNFYSDTNYVLLQLIVERKTGSSLRQFVKQRILQPLSLKNTGYYSETDDPETVSVTTTIEGYLKRSDELDSVVKLDPSFIAFNKSYVNTTRAVERSDGASGMVSAARDLASFGKALYSGKLLKKQTKEWLFSIPTGIEDKAVGTSQQRVMKIHKETSGILFASTGDGPAGINLVLGIQPKTETVVVGFANIFGLLDEADFIREQIFSQLIGL